MTTNDKNIPSNNFQKHELTDRKKERVSIVSHEVDDKLIGDDFEINEALEPVKEDEETADSKSGY